MDRFSEGGFTYCSNIEFRAHKWVSKYLGALVVDLDTSVVVLLFSLLTLWLGRLLNYTRTFLSFLLPGEEMSLVQPEVGEEGAGVGVGAGGDGGAAGGVCFPGGGGVLGTRRACADVGSQRAFVLVDFLCPGLFSGTVYIRIHCKVRCWKEDGSGLF